MNRYRVPSWVPAVVGVVAALIAGLFTDSLWVSVVVAVVVGLVFLAACVLLRPFLAARDERRHGLGRGA